MAEIKKQRVSVPKTVPQILSAVLGCGVFEANAIAARKHVDSNAEAIIAAYQGGDRDAILRIIEAPSKPDDSAAKPTEIKASPVKAK